MDSTLTIRISNELGNQLFMYASAYAIAKKLNRKLYIDDETAFLSKKNISKYALDNFNISSEIADNDHKFKSLLGYIKRKFFIKTDHFRKNKFFYIERKNSNNITCFQEDFMNQSFNNNLFMEGHFESEKYFIDCKDEISSEFIFKKADLYQKNSYFNEIVNSNSISLCIRQNRFIEGKDNNTNENIRKSWEFTLEQISYTNKSVELIKSKVNDPKFFLWSNDFTNLESKLFNFECQKINLNNINENVDRRILSLYLLAQCKHFIVTTSSFNWWGAWLSLNQNKLIIRPSSFKNFTINNTDLWPENWLSV